MLHAFGVRMQLARLQFDAMFVSRCRCRFRSSASDRNFGMFWASRFGMDAPAAPAPYATVASANVKSAFERQDAQIANYYRRDARDTYDDPRDDREWSQCVGTCFSGECKLDLSRPGCCYLFEGEYYESSLLPAAVHAAQASVEAVPLYRVGDKRGQLFCWEKGESI